MDSIGKTLAQGTTPLPRPKAGGSSAPLLPKPSEPALPIKKAEQGVDVAEAKRQQRVRRAAENIANSYILGDRSFTIFKDATGQYITRFRGLRDGQVTYIPEPELLRRSTSTYSEPIISLDV